MKCFPEIRDYISPLHTRKVSEKGEIKNFFNESAEGFTEKHGDEKALLEYRVALIKETTEPNGDSVLLDIGCGVGHHLMAMSRDIDRGIGVDFSEEMIREAKKRLARHGGNESLTFLVDDAERLESIGDSTVDIVICIGALEHMPNKQSVLSSSYRALKRPGRMVCLTPNGGSLWYRYLAPALGLETRHLSTDRFLKPADLKRLFKSSGFADISLHGWSFIPRGDLHPSMSKLLDFLDKIGAALGPMWLRGGLIGTARKL